jgi:osmotically-inducible protein OsmY
VGTIQNSVQQVFARSSRLSSNGSINVATNGNVVILRGQVSSPRESALAEAMARLTPGVWDVRNELVYPGAP